VAEVAHGSSRFWFALIVLAVPPGTAVPSLGSLAYPAFAHWSKALAAWGTGLHCESPAWTICRHPSFERMMVRLGITTARL